MMMTMMTGRIRRKDRKNTFLTSTRASNKSVPAHTFTYIHYTICVYINAERNEKQRSDGVKEKKKLMKKGIE
jgi:hypothetical protein